MKKSARARASGRKYEADRISNLPDPVLHLILSRLPTTEEVIRTSILSKRWRYLWTLVPSIDIDFSRRPKPLRELGRSKFKEFVSGGLTNNSLNLDSFRLCCLDYYNMATIGEWIHGAVTRNVKLLDLMFCPVDESEVITLPHFLVTCGSLEVLRLCLFGRFLSLPNITGFSSLRVLELNNVKLHNDNLVKGFLKSCPLLEDLCLKNCLLNELGDLCIECPKLKNLYINNLDGISGIDFEEVEGWRYGPHSVHISCPKLVFLEFSGYIVYHTPIFESLDSLKKVVIQCEDLDDDYIDNSICEWFVRISHVEYLSLSLPFIIMCSFGVSWCRPRRGIPESLPNLKTLELTIGWVRMDAETRDELIKILLCSPNLESLHLIFNYQLFWIWELNLNEAEWRILTRHLKRVEFLEFYGREEELDFVRSMLEHGNELEKVVFGWGNEARSHESSFHERSMKAMKKVSEFHKASSTVKLVTLINK